MRSTSVEAWLLVYGLQYIIHTTATHTNCIMTAKAPVAPAPLAEVPIPNTEKSVVDIKTGEIAQEDVLPFDPAALKAKYLDERDKRLARNEGTEQYISLNGNLERYLKDPWVEPGFERDPIEEEVDVVIVGGGYGAQVVAVRLIEAGVNNFKIIEKAGDFGGTCKRAKT